jgi:hypothetical protein
MTLVGPKFKAEWDNRFFLPKAICDFFNISR